MKKILSVILSFIIFFPSYLLSFLPKNIDTDFTFESGYSDSEIMVCNEPTAVETSGEFKNGSSVLYDFSEVKYSCFNYFGIKYSTDSYSKGIVTYTKNGEKYSEEFFLEPGENGIFYSFIDCMLDKVKSSRLCSVSFEPLDKETGSFTLSGIGLFNREIPDREVYIQNDGYKLGVDLLWGGALSYLEDLDSGVEAVNVGGRIFVDSNASKRYNTESVNSNVNLINRNDPGRLVQQSYYGTFGDGYESGEYMGNKWNYNPVQGGNQFGDASKIVDIVTSGNSLYVKCRPLDWAKPAEDMTPSYMEATYTLKEGLVDVSCRFVDFSGYKSVTTTQEMPAFYCIEPFNRFVYYGGNYPWTNDPNLSYENKLIFWPDAGYPNFNSTENWAAFIGEYDDSFGIGIYVPSEPSFLAGVYEREKTQNTDPSKDGPTSYIAAVEWLEFASFKPIEYNYYISTGTVNEMRSSFETVK